MYKLYNGPHLISECLSRETLEETKNLLIEHYPTYKKYKKTNYLEFTTKYDEEHSNKVKYIEYLKHKCSVIEYEINNDISKENNHRKLYQLKLELNAANIFRTSLEKSILMEQRDIHEKMLETIPYTIKLTMRNYSFLDFCIPTISERK